MIRGYERIKLGNVERCVADCQPVVHRAAVYYMSHPLSVRLTDATIQRLGMIFMPGGYRRTRADTWRIVAALEAKLALYPSERDLANGEAWL